MHRILERQIRKLASEGLLQSPGIQALLNAISETYTHYDEDRTLIDRSLDLSSKELSSINQALRQERDKAKAIVASMRDGLMVVDQDRAVVSLNPAAEQLLQLDAGMAVGKKIESLVQVLHNKQLLVTEQRPIYLTLQKRQAIVLSQDDDIYLETSRGKVFPVALSTAPLVSNNKVSGAVLVFRDITNEREATKVIEQKVVQRTKEVKERRAELLASITTLDLGFVLTDEKMVVIMTNPAAERIIKAPKLDSLDTIEKLLDHDLRLKEICATCMKEKRSDEIKDFSYNNQFLHLYLSPIIVAHKATGVAIIIEDITEAKIIERSKDEFFSIASHELRTPLTAIRGNTAIIQQYYQDEIHDPAINNLVKDVHDSSVQLISIVNDFLDLSRLDQGRMMFKKEVIDLNGLITTVVLELHGTASAKGLKLIYNRPREKDVLVIGDMVRLKQVLINLIGNSIKYTENGLVTVDVNQAKNSVTTLVTDTGRGLSPQSQLLLFRKFQQAGESIYTRDTTRSTGLGLYISKLMIEGMGGKIKLDKSELGKGSTFSFTLSSRDNAHK